MELFKLFGSIVVDNDKANASIHKTEQIASSSTGNMSGMFKKLGAAIVAGFSIQKIKEFGVECIDAYKVQAQAETQLETVMRQRMGATDESIQSIKNLASAQQELGVVGDEVQLAGAQQLSTFLNTDSALKTLIPAMNNLAVQQNGVNVSSQSMVNIGNLMGKVMQGQVGALTRVGVTFTEAQEKVLKYGTEEERAAMLAQVITDNVGNMNEALAQTDDGKQQQVKNTLGDMQEVIGQKLIPVQTAYYNVVLQLATFASTVVIPAIQSIVSFLTNLGAELQKHPNLLTAIEVGLGTLTGAFIAFKAAAVLTSVIQGFQQAQLALKLFTMAQGASQIAQAAFNGTLTIGETLVALFTGKVTLAQLASAGWTAAQTALNAVLAANPIMVVVIAIGALVGAIAVLYTKNEEFRDMVNTTWAAIKNTIGTVVQALQELISTFIAFITPIWEQWGNTIMTVVQTAFQIVSTVVDGALKTIQAIIKTVTAVIKGDWSGAWEGIKSIFSTVWNTIKSVVKTAINGVKSTISSGLENAKNTVSTIFNSIKSTISEKINGAKDAVHSAIERIKSFFHFSWSLPPLKLPHISISGKFSLKPLSVPHFGISWYKKGGVMMDPTMFGFDPKAGNAMVGGEAGPEAIAPISTLQAYIKSAVNDNDEIKRINQNFDKMFGIMEKYFPMFANQQMVLDTGVLVAETAGKMDEQLGLIQKRKVEW